MSEKYTDFSPLYFVPGVQEGDRWFFQTDTHTLTVNDDSDQLKTILQHSDGHSPVRDVLTKCKEDDLDEIKAEQIIYDLVRLGIIIDSREAAIKLHDKTNNPQAFFRSLTNSDIHAITSRDAFSPESGKAINIEATANYIGSLSLKRESCRSFPPNP